MKILLNCLPPADIHNPSISLSILKSFMEKNGATVEIKYWNFILSLMSDYTDSEDTEIRLLPFLSILNDWNNNDKGNERILSLLQQIHPEFKSDDPFYYSDFLDDTKDEILGIIRNEIAEIDFSKIALLGITAKYNQWIPGMILAQEIKNIAPDVKIIVGGFGSDDVAHEAMSVCEYFDFVTWGEGEYPLLELNEQLKKDRDYSMVPRLIYRDKTGIKQSSVTKSKYLDFENYLLPDYSDFINTFPEEEDQDLINFPINTIRSCHWRKCKFCDFNKGYKLRMRSPECIVNEIEQINNQYGFSTFTFVDSDTFGSLDHFEKLLDLIIDLKYQKEEDFIFWAEIIPNNKFNARMMEKMAIAGFKNLFIGYDALSDSLLKKMNKSNSFSDNLFFVKHSIKNAIAPFVNVIKHIPQETEDDICECIDNLHFLRFFYNDSTVPFSHNYVPLVLSSMTKYYSEMSENDIKKYDYDLLGYLMPNHFTNTENRFHLFRLESNSPSNKTEWEKLIEIEEYYKSKRFAYKILEHKGVYYYTEYCNDTEIVNITFGEPEYAFVIKAAEQKVIDFADLLSEITKVFPATSEERLKEVLHNLKDSYLLYFNESYSNIISVIELSN